MEPCCSPASLADTKNNKRVFALGRGEVILAWNLLLLRKVKNNKHAVWLIQQASSLKSSVESLSSASSALNLLADFYFPTYGHWKNITTYSFKDSFFHRRKCDCGIVIRYTEWNNIIGYKMNKIILHMWNFIL